MARKAGVPIGRDILLRVLHSLSDDDQHQRRVLGIDDVALRRKQHRYGMLLTQPRDPLTD